MVGQLEATFEVSRGDALVEHVAALLLVVGLLLASERQRVLLCLDREIRVGEAGDCNRDAIVVLAGPRDIVGWIARYRAFHAADLVEHGEQPVKANGRTIVGSKIKRTHSMTSLFERHANGPPPGPDLSYYAASWPTYYVPVDAARRSQGANRLFSGAHGILVESYCDSLTSTILG